MIIPKHGDFIKHRASMDVAIKIDKVYRFGHKWQVKGIWWNQGSVSSWPIGIKAKFYIKKEHLKNWLVCMEPNADCIRKVKWEPIT